MKTHLKNLFLVPVLIAGLSLIPAGRATAQAFTTLHTFSSLSNGINPDTELVLSGNTLYGTTVGGGSSSRGIVFAVNTDGTGFTNLHRFTELSPFQFNSDGANPHGGLNLSGNTLYGTALFGGSSGRGTLYAVNTDGTGFTNLHSFTGGSGGSNPEANLILSGNTLYGTAQNGVSAGLGTVFAVNTDGTGFTNLHTFTGGSGGADPYCGLILLGNTLYGTTVNGGSAGNGTVFAVNTDGTGFTNLHSFTGGDGADPFAGLILSSNTLYGTAQDGGSSGLGTVFAVNTDGTGFTNLHSFTGVSDGANPEAGLVLSGNTLYGTAANGGSSNNGTVFAINTDGAGFTNLYNFTGGSDGNQPYAGLILSGNTLYGTAYGGPSGSMFAGTVFSINLLCPTITVGPSSLPDGEVGMAYNQTNTASGGTAPYTYAVTSGSLPPGLTLSSNGVLSGTLNNAGTYNFTVTTTDTDADTGGCPGSQSYTITAGVDFQQAAGTYNGLFSDMTNGVSHQSAGFFTMKVKTNQAFSGKLVVDGDTLAFSGKLDLTGEGVITKPIARKGKPSLTASLHLTGNDTITGTVSPTNGAWVAELAADRAVFNLTNTPPTNFLGAYTLVIPGSTNAATSPGGDGYGTVTNAATGFIKLTGALGDGAVLAQKVSVSKDGLWPLYVPAYLAPHTYTNALNVVLINKERKGSIIGWVTVSNGLSASLTWIKTPVTNTAFYPLGFTNNDVDILSSRYVMPLLGTTALSISNNGVVMTMDGNLSAPFTNQFTLRTNNSFLFTLPNVNAQKLALNPKSGLVGGSFFNPDNPAKRTTIKGVVLQDQNVGRGFFLGTNQSGSVRLEGN